MAHAIATRDSRGLIVASLIALFNAQSMVCAAKASVFAVMDGPDKIALFAIAPTIALVMVHASTSPASATLGLLATTVLNYPVPTTAPTMALVSMALAFARKSSVVLTAPFLLAPMIAHTQASAMMGCVIAILVLRDTIVR